MICLFVKDRNVYYLVFDLPLCIVSLIISITMVQDSQWALMSNMIFAPPLEE